jgi:hypothetical protein
VWRIWDVYPVSRILIFTHPGSRIQDPKTATKERGEKKFVVITFYVATNFTKLQIILVFTQKIVNKLSKIRVWDPGSQIQGPKRHRILDPGSGSSTLLCPLFTLCSLSLVYAPPHSRVFPLLYSCQLLWHSADKIKPTAVKMSSTTAKTEQIWPTFKTSKPDPVLGKL